MNRALKTMFRSLRVRNYRIYFFAQIISMIGTWAQITAQMWLVLQLTGSGVALGLVSALQFLPVLFAGAWGGVVADRFDKRRLLMATQGGGGLIALVLGSLTVTGAVELWMVYALAFLMGCVLVIDVPTRQSFLMEMVGPGEVANAVGLNSTVFTTARIIGPALSAALISTVGIGWAFLLNGVSYFAVIAGLRAMDPNTLMRSEPVARTKGQLLDGLRYVWAKPVLRSSLLLMAVVGTLAFNFRIFLPLMAESVFKGDAGTYGILSSVMGAGTLVGALIATGWSRPTRGLLVGSALSFGALMLLGAAAPTLAFALLAFFPIGAASIIFVATCNAVLQLNSTDAMRGRVMALYSVVFLGTTPIGGPLVGWIAQQFGPRAAVGLAGAATVAGALAAVHALRKSRLPRQSQLAPALSPEEVAPGEVPEPPIHSGGTIRSSFRRLPLFGQRK